MNKLYCYNRWMFREMCEYSGWDRKNIPENSAFISICGTFECQSLVLFESEDHYLGGPRKNILNLDFDDITSEKVEIPEYPGRYVTGITLAQAKEAVKFIKKNLGKDFYVHCRAGHSRSQAFVRYILDMYSGIYNFSTRPENPPINYNQYVLSMLKDAARELGEYWRCCFLQNGYSVKKISNQEGNTIVKIENFPEVDIILEPSGKCKITQLGLLDIDTDELELFSILGNILLKKS